LQNRTSQTEITLQKRVSCFESRGCWTFFWRACIRAGWGHF